MDSMGHPADAALPGILPDFGHASRSMLYSPGHNEGPTRPSWCPKVALPEQKCDYIGNMVELFRPLRAVFQKIPAPPTWIIPGILGNEGDDT